MMTDGIFNTSKVLKNGVLCLFISNSIDIKINNHYILKRIIPMKKTVRNALLLTSLIASALSISPTALSESQTDAGMKLSTQSNVEKDSAQQKANKVAVDNQAKAQHELLDEINKGVSEAFTSVMKGGQLITEGKEKEAIKALEAATGKFDIALAANPELGLILIDSRIRVTEMITNSATVKAQISLAQGLLKDSKLQAARAVLLPMQDDVETRATYLPMATYPDAIKLATKMLIEGDNDAAVKTLLVALSTVVQEVSVIPLSLVRAESMVIAAANLDKEKGKEEAMKLLDLAEDQLQIAVALGYTDKQSALYDDLSVQIKAIKKEAAGPNVVKKLYDKLKLSFKGLIKENSGDKKKEKKESSK